MEEPKSVIPLRKGIEMQEAKIEAGIARLRRWIARLEETRKMVAGWIIAAREQGDDESVAQYEIELEDIDLRLEGARLHIEEGQAIVDERQWQQFQHEMQVFEEEMRADILKTIGDELAMVEGMIAMLEATETVSAEREREIVELRSRKQALDATRTKYEKSI
ncbi:MAG: hypothetical protein WBO92_02130 [Candidatus Moraniibacteriota bacterium]